MCGNRRHDHTCNHNGNFVDKVHIEGRPDGRNERLKTCKVLIVRRPSVLRM